MALEIFLMLWIQLSNSICIRDNLVNNGFRKKEVEEVQRICPINARR
jgi:hypothetical protein